MFSPCHKKNKNPHQNIPEWSILEVSNLTHKLMTSPLPPSSTDINPTTPMLTLYDQTLFYPSIFCRPNTFFVNLFDPKHLLEPKQILNPNFCFLTQHFWWKKFWTPNFVGPQIFVRLKKFLTKFFDPKIFWLKFLSPKIFLPLKYFHTPKYFFTEIFFWHWKVFKPKKLFWPKNYFDPKIILNPPQNFWTRNFF